MKKPIKRTIVSAIISAGLLVGTMQGAMAANERGTQAYKDIVNNALTEANAAGLFYADAARGTLFDIDQNGTDELILLYTTKTEQIPFPFLYCSVYSLSGGHAVKLLDKEALYAQAGGPNGVVGVAKQNGQNLLYIRSETGETGEDAHRSGNWNFYQLKNIQLSKVSSVSYDYIQSDLSDLGHCTGSAVWDGRAISWEEYLSRVSEITLEIELTEDGPGSTLNELLDQIDEMKSIKSPSPWAVEEVNAARDATLIPPDLDSNYQTNITRAEFCDLMSQLLTVQTGKTIDQLLSEAGVEPSAPYLDTRNANILAISALGIVNGVGNNRFDPNASITREEASVMLARVASKFEGLQANGEPLAFADKALISTWAKEAVDVVSACVSNGIPVMNGTEKNYFSPKGTYTREQSIMTSLRLYRFIGNAGFINNDREVGSLLPYCYVGGHRLHYGEYKSVNFDDAAIILKANGTADYHMDIAPTTEYDSAIHIQQDSVAWEVSVMDDYGTSVSAIWFELEDTAESLCDGRQGYIVSDDDGFQNDWIAFKYAG